jgi:hypothetical protein
VEGAEKPIFLSIGYSSPGMRSVAKGVGDRGRQPRTECRYGARDLGVLDHRCDAPQNEVQLFLWRPPQPVEDIDTMQPVLFYELPLKA